MSDFGILDENIILNTRTGELKNVDLSNSTDSYAVILKCGHCGKGYFIPLLFTITANSPEMAVEIATKLGKVKKSAKSVVLGVEKIDQKTYLALEHINDCDPYFYTTTDGVFDLYERRVAMEGLVDFEESDIPKRNTKIPKSVIKTADKYDDKYVLQRYFAPVRYGEKLVFPKKANMKQLIDEYLYYNTIELGFKRRKVNALSFYYQIYGENNNLGIKYNNGVVSFKDLNSDKIHYIEVPENMKKHLDQAKEQFEEEKKKQSQSKPHKDIKIPSATEKFQKRYAKYKEIISSNKIK